MANFRRTVIGKNSLIIAARGETELASQIFNYDQIREVRVNLEKGEVKILMNYDEAFFRVISIKPKSDSAEHKREAEDELLKFYNNLLNAIMKLTKEELENIKKQQEKIIEKQKEEQKKLKV